MEDQQQSDLQLKHKLVSESDSLGWQGVLNQLLENWLEGPGGSGGLLEPNSNEQERLNNCLD